MAAQTLSVLIISPPPSVQGGVSVFIETIKTSLAHCNVTSFYVGRTPDIRENKLQRIKRVIIAPFMIVRLLRKQHIDVVHINPSFNTKSLVRDGLILLALRLARFTRVLVYFHGWEWDCQRRLARITLLQRMCAWLLNGVTHIIVLAPEFKQALVAMGVLSTNILLSRTMFDGTALKAVNIAPPIKKRSVLYMSRLVREKGVYQLIAAFARIAREFPDVHLIIAGDGEEARFLPILVSSYGLEERVSFPGYVKGAAKYALLNQCTLFALPTYFPEGMPVALLEAMGAGKPLITGKAGAISHIISDPENGVVLEQVTIQSVEDALRRLLNNKAYCEEVGMRNAAYAWEHFEARQVTAEIEALYNDIATSS